MADNNVKIKLSATDEASPTIKAAMDKLTQSIDKLNVSQAQLSQSTAKVADSHQELNTGALNLAAGLNILQMGANLVSSAFHSVEAQLEKAIEEALEAEKVQNQLTGALVNTGIYTAKLSAEIDKYVKEVEEMNGVNGETVKSQIAMGIQMGLTVEQAKKLEEASRKLAAQAGISTEEAFNKLKMTLQGASRGVAQYLPQVKELGEAKLKAGAAIDVVNKALDASYKIYQQSLPAALTRAQNSINDVYKAFGQIITQNPLTIKAVDMFSEAMGKVAHIVEDVGKYVATHQGEIERLGLAFAKAASVILGGGGIIFALANVGTAITALGTVFTILTGPIGITLAAVAALTVAFYKWPGVLDIAVGGIKKFVGMMLNGLGTITEYMGKFVGMFDNDLQVSMQKVTESLQKSAEEWKTAGAASIEYGQSANKSAEIVVEATNKDTEARRKNLEAIAAQNKAAQNLSASYAGYDIGTENQRKALEAQVQDREKDKKDFESYLNAKMRLSISKAEEEQLTLAKVKANALKGSGGSEEKAATADFEIKEEQRKQAELTAQRDKNLLDEQQYQEAMLQSRQNAANAQLEADLANQQIRANLLGDSEEGYAARAALDEQRWQLELQKKMERAQAENATTAEINIIKEQAEAEHQAAINQIREDQINADIKRNEQLNKNWEATLGRIRLAQMKHGQILGTIRGIQATEEFRGAQQALADLASLRSSSSKKAFEVGKAAATAQATINTFTAATGAYAAMSAIPIVGPALGAVAAAAAIAAGIMNIQKIQSQKFAGGQADEGMDSVPGSLSGKSFILSQGERVVQPSANRDLKDFLNKEKGGGDSGGGSRGNSYNITLNYGGAGGEGDARKMGEIVIDYIRAESERGRVIMSSKGIAN